MRKSKFVLALLVSGLAFGATVERAKAEYGIAGFNTNCRADMRSWKKRHGAKAIAVSNIYLVGKSEFQSCGTSWDYSTKNNAASVAMIECRSELRKRHAPKSARCVVRAALR